MCMHIWLSKLVRNHFSTTSLFLLPISLSFWLKREANEKSHDKKKDEKEEKKRLEAEKKEQKEREKKENDARKKFKVSEQEWKKLKKSTSTQAPLSGFRSSH